jgi:polar amino acid transport system substrate-binding protein
LFFGYCAFCNAQDVQNEKIRFSEDPWPPYTISPSEDSPIEGMAVTLVEEVFKRLNIPIEMKLYLWKRCLEQMKNGQRDALMLLGYDRVFLGK